MTGLLITVNTLLERDEERNGRRKAKEKARSSRNKNQEM